MQQPYQRIKLVLVDDGSTDESAELCDELARTNDRIVVIHQENGGVSAARNAGITYILKNCTCLEKSYIAFLDADDAWSESFCSKRVSELMIEGYDLIGFQSCLCNDDLSRSSEPVSLKAGEYRGGNSSLWIHSTQHFGAMFYKCNLLLHYNIRFKTLKYSEDKIFAMTCMYLAKNIYLDNVLMYYYRQNVASAIHNRPYGILFYAPIIEAYIQWEKELAKWENEIRGNLHEGTVLARIYLKDMIDEHFQMGGSKADIDEFIKNDLMCQSVLKSVGNEEETKAKDFQYSSFYIFRSKIKGLKKKLIWKITGMKILKYWIDKLRYPIQI